MFFYKLKIVVLFSLERLMTSLLESLEKDERRLWPPPRIVKD